MKPQKIFVVTPHPDDETLGCGGTLARHIGNGDIVHWIIVTSMTLGQGYSVDRLQRRDAEIAKVAELYGIRLVHRMAFPTTRLDTIALGDLVSEMKDLFEEHCPEIVYVPYRLDAHSDHATVFDMTVACCKWFRSPSIRALRAYETLSETSFGWRPENRGFRPNLYVDITGRLETKLAAMRLYAGELQEHPFPRSERAIRALAELRGSEAGFMHAEAFEQLYVREF